MSVKRFTLLDETIIDNEEVVDDGGKQIYWIVEYVQRVKLVELLNELHEENQDLKSFNKDLAENLSTCANARISKDNRIERLEEKIQRERTSFMKTHERWSKEAENKIKELSEENEQLKKDIEYYKIERLALFEYLDKKDDLKLELKVEK